METIKKYSNRRLYDTSTSSYITLEELAEKIRSGTDVRVVTAKTEEDITQEVLAQIILESRGAARLLPVPLLMRLIRMGEDRLAEFFGQFMSWSLEIYLRFKDRTDSMGSYNPFSGNVPQNMFQGPEAFFRMFMNQSPWNQGAAPWQDNGEGTPWEQQHQSGEAVEEPAEEPPPPEEPVGQEGSDPEVEELRSEIDELKEMIQGMAKGDGDE